MSVVTGAAAGYVGDVRPGFSPPDFSQPLDVEAHLARIPATATVKGLVAESIVEAVAAERKPPITTVRFASFRDYPLRDIVALKVDAARAVRPDAPLREGLAVVGRRLFPKFVSTLLGRVMYGVFGGNVSSILRLANKSYEQTQTLGRVETAVVGPTSIRMHFTNTHTFLDAYHVGVLQGTLQACKVEGHVLVRMASEIEGDLLVEWQPRAG